MREQQEARKSQIGRLSQLAQPIESDVTFLFNEKIPKASNYVESTPIDNQATAHAVQKQTKTGDLLQLEARVHEMTRMSYCKFSDFIQIIK